MRRLLIHQILASALNILLPYAIIFVGFSEWHLEHSRLMVYILLARSLMYNSYTSMFTENTIKHSENIWVKYIVVTVVVLFVLLISKGLFNNPVYLSTLVAATLFEDYRRKELYHGNTRQLNLVLVLTFLFFLFAGSNLLFLLVLSGIWFILGLRKTKFSGRRITHHDLTNRWAYILLAIFGYAIGGGYLDEVALVLNPEEFEGFRYVLFILAPMSFIAQVAEYLWFSKVYNGSRVLLLLLSFVVSVFSILVITSIIYKFLHPKWELIIVVVINALLISANSLLRIILRNHSAYNFLLLVVIVGSLPYFFMSLSTITSALHIYSFMTVGLGLMFLLLLLKTISLHKKRGLFEGLNIH